MFKLLFFSIFMLSFSGEAMASHLSSKEPLIDKKVSSSSLSLPVKSKPIKSKSKSAKKKNSKGQKPSKGSLVVERDFHQEVTELRRYFNSYTDLNLELQVNMRNTYKHMVRSLMSDASSQKVGLTYDFNVVSKEDFKYLKWIYELYPKAEMKSKKKRKGKT